MLVMVVLGNRINDGGSMSDNMLRRLNLTLKAYKTFSPGKIILSGGIANRKVNLSEARMMYNFLLANGIPAEILVLEDKSLTTKQNAEFSAPIAVELGATELLILTSAEHMNRRFLNPVKLFQKQIAKYTNSQIKLTSYCENGLTEYHCD